MARKDVAAGAIPTPRTVADLTLPLDAYDLSPAERKIVEKARFMMLADCTRTFGVELKALPPSPEWPERHRNADYLHWMGDQQVEKYGYTGPPAQLTQSFTTYSVTDEQFIVLEGKRRKFHGKAVPAGGCSGMTEALLDQGSLDLLGGKPGRVREEEDLLRMADEASDGAYKDVRIREAMRVWSECMQDAGFDYPDPVAAFGDPRWSYDAATDQFGELRGSPAEIATASADETCRMETNYSGARQAAYRDSQQRIIAKNQARLDRIKIINQAQIKNARKFLAGELAVTWQ
ncbi:hypothetical protein [Planotetraspora kaengkrachanensis]|uniref:Uncharacterized protein n=1 Tax=Planotetraspora kaengkrachanensis TaxID=575193 RepID=A0A8J3V945_9ACTN|nr:hypothetical protein [Planotetraspora kaengkrachanensis]GIG82497.1 hypothetical protein Pka01_56240 [Planotetraspora kaengkrachanensis]